MKVAYPHSHILDELDSSLLSLKIARHSPCSLCRICAGLHPPPKVDVVLDDGPSDLGLGDLGQYGSDDDNEEVSSYLQVCACGHNIKEHNADDMTLGNFEFQRRGRVAIRLDELLMDAGRLLDFDFVDDDILALRTQLRVASPSPSRGESPDSSILSDIPVRKRRASSSSLSDDYPIGDGDVYGSIDEDEGPDSLLGDERLVQEIKQRCDPQRDQQYLEILNVIDALAAFVSMSDAIRTLRFAILGLVNVMTTPQADVLWQGDFSDELVDMTAALNALVWIFQKYQSASAAIPWMVAEYTKNLTDFLNSRGELVATQNHNPQERSETATVATPRPLMPQIALAFLIEVTNDMQLDAGGAVPFVKGVFVTDFNGRRLHVPLELCACWQDLCLFLKMFLRGEKESNLIVNQKFGVHLAGEVDLLSGETWNSWISNQGGGAPCTVDLYAIINDDSGGCPACSNPAQYPLASQGSFQQCLSCGFTFLVAYHSSSEEPGSNTIDLGGLTQPPLIPEYALVQSDLVEYQSHPNLPSETRSLTQASAIGAVSLSAINSDGSGPSVPKHIQVVRRRKPFDSEEEQNQVVDTNQALSITLPSHYTAASDTSRAPFGLVSFCRDLYTFVLFRLPDRYCRNAPRPVPSESQTLGGATRGPSWETFHNNFKLDITYFGTAAGIALGALFTTLQISSAANDPIVRTVVQLSIVCLFFGLIYSMILWVTFGKLKSEVEGIAVINRTPRNTFWDLWIMLSMPLAWILWGFIYFAVFLLSPNQVYGPRTITTLVFVVGVAYFGLIIYTAKRFPIGFQ